MEKDIDKLLKLVRETLEQENPIGILLPFIEKNGVPAVAGVTNPEYQMVLVIRDKRINGTCILGQAGGERADDIALVKKALSNTKHDHNNILKN